MEGVVEGAELAVEGLPGDGETASLRWAYGLRRGGRPWRVVTTGRWSEGKLESKRTSVEWASSEGDQRRMWSRAPTKPCGLTHVGASARGPEQRSPRRASVGRTG